MAGVVAVPAQVHEGSRAQHRLRHQRLPKAVVRLGRRVRSKPLALSGGWRARRINQTTVSLTVLPSGPIAQPSSSGLPMRACSSILPLIVSHDRCMRGISRQRGSQCKHALHVLLLRTRAPPTC